jgi:hypothetical protein
MKLNYFTFYKALKAASVITAKGADGEIRPMLKNIYVDVRKNEVIIEALDGYLVLRITWRDIQSDIETRFLLTPDIVKQLPKDKEKTNEIEITKDKIKYITPAFSIEHDIEQDFKNFEWFNLQSFFRKTDKNPTKLIAIGVDRMETVIKSMKKFGRIGHESFFKLYMPDEDIKPLFLEYEPIKNLHVEYVVIPARLKKRES